MSDASSHTTTVETQTPGHADPHVASHDAHDVSHHLKLYWIIGGVLFVFTLITVALAYVDFDKMFSGHGWNMKIGLVVASFKVSLVGAVFMHLKGEKPTIWRFLYLTVFFFLGLFLLTWLAIADPIFGTWHITR
jgi:caa(3)-type oxidase subunit IV